MNVKDALDVLVKAGLDIDGADASWRDSLQLLAALDAVGRDGANVLLKIDGGRSDDRPYTVVVSGGRLGEEFFRKDGAALVSLLREAVVFYAARRDGSTAGNT